MVNCNGTLKGSFRLVEKVVSVSPKGLVRWLVYHIVPIKTGIKPTTKYNYTPSIQTVIMQSLSLFHICALNWAGTNEENTMLYLPITAYYIHYS